MQVETVQTEGQSEWHAEQQMPVPSDVPEELSQVIQKMTSLDPEKRPKAEDVDSALAHIFEQLSASGATAKYLGSE